MIITRQKDFSEIMNAIKGKEKVFLIGCTLCATVCKTGGETELNSMADAVRKRRKTIAGRAMLDPACNLLQGRRLSRSKKKELDSADVILSLACGSGTQTIAEIFRGKKVCSVNDTLFQGEVRELTVKKARFEQKCSLCGECILEQTGSICPVTGCPKGLRNGPCGGIKHKKCEVSSDLDCVWILIYERLRILGGLEKVRKIQPLRDYSKNRNPRKFVIT